MAGRKVFAEGRTEGTILADSRGARKRFGFGGAPLSPITSAPKHTDQWFVEFISPTGKNMDVSGQAQSVSPITIQTTTQPVDRYGKREYIPTRVDFPEVTVTFYDTVDGKMMIFAKSIYAEFFKNFNINPDSGIQSAIEDINSGRAIGGTIDSPSTKNFSKVTLYHFFGGFDSGNGFIQRIVLINPVVTSITFSESDYSQSGLRTITLNLQPENIVMGTPTESPAVPKWMQEGLEFILEDFDPDNMSEFEKKIIQDLWIQNYQMKNGNVNISNIPKEQAYMSEQVKALQDLSKYYYDAKRTEIDPNATAKQKEEFLKKFIDVRNSMPTISVSPENKINLEDAQVVPIKSKPNDLDSQKTRASEVMSGISTYSGPGSSVEAGGTVPPTSEDIRNQVKDELVNAHLDGRPVNIQSASELIETLMGGDPRGMSGENVEQKVNMGFTPMPDANNDGIPDWQQADVVNDANGNGIRKQSSNADKIAELDRQRRRDKVGKSPKTTTVRDSDSGVNIGGERYYPGEPMTEVQVAATSARIMMGNTPPTGQMLEDYEAGKALLNSGTED